MAAYDFSTLIAALDTRAQNLANAADAKDVVYLGKAVEALLATDDKILGSNNLSDLADAATSLANLGFSAQFTNPTADQAILWNNALQKWVNADISKEVYVSTTNPSYNSGTHSLGDVWANSTSGELFVCYEVNSGSPTTYKWRGTEGSVVGIKRGEELFLNENFTGHTQPSYGAFTTAWTVPTDVTSVSVVLVGGGGGGSDDWGEAGGGGGALAYKNNIAVTPGDTMTFVIGNGGGRQSAGGNTSVSMGGSILFEAEGGIYNARAFSNIAKPLAGTLTPDNIYAGRGGLSGVSGYGGGGGAGGYSGNGGNGYYGSSGNTNNTLNNDINGTGGAGAGGNGYSSSTYSHAGGGGVGLYGEGSNGVGSLTSPINSFGQETNRGGGGSGGEAGADNSNTLTGENRTFGSWDNTAKAFAQMSEDGTYDASGTRLMAHGQGGFFGGGGSGGGTSVSDTSYFQVGGMGGARVVYGDGRSFPSTNVERLSPLNLDGTTPE